MYAQGDVVVLRDGMDKHYTIGPDGHTVESWRGPLLCYDMTGWKSVGEQKFLRPRPVCPPRGFAIREPTSKFEWKPGMKELITELIVKHTTPSTVPCEQIANKLVMTGRWDDLFCPTKTQIKNFVSSYFVERKKKAQHALERQGKRSYSKFSLKWLQAEVRHRGMQVGRRKVTGCIQLLEQHDDDHPNRLAKLHRKSDYEVVPERLGFAAFRKSIESRSTKVGWLEWYRKECAYQQLQCKTSLRETGMAKLLHKHYLDRPPKHVIKRHDENHVVNVKPAYAVGDKVDVFWRGKWYDATVTKYHRNNTWDVLYPPPDDQTFCTRLPAALLRPSICIR